MKDMMLYFEWANDPAVRQNSINKEPIALEDHIEWFTRSIGNEETQFLIFDEGGKNIGQLRIDLDKERDKAIINFSIDAGQRGKGYGTKMLLIAYKFYLTLNLKKIFMGYVQAENKASSKAFEKAGFQLQSDSKIIQGEPYLVYKIK